MHRARPFLILLALAGLLLGLFPGALGAQEITESTQLPTDTVVVRLYYGTRDRLNAVASELDIWEVHLDQGYAVAAVAPAEYAWLQRLGYPLEIDAAKTALLGIHAPLDPRYYYFDNNVPNSNNRYMVDFLQQVNADYPNLVELLDIGDAWQASHGGHHRDLWVLRITNEDPAYGSIADKPTFVLHANIHAREVSTPEMAIRYIKYLTSGYNGQGGYGVDPDVTWLVDWNVAYIMVSANPDGHAVNEQDTGANRRKNMDNDDGCVTPSLWGVDLNRNHHFRWACCGGSSGNPCSETYRGPSRSSEPETFYFQNFITMNNILRDQNGPNGPDTIPPAAPVTTTGLLLSLHTYSDYVLWPWGFTQSPAPNSSQLVKIGRKFSYYTGYDDLGFLYTVDGDTHDWSYGQLGVASFTFEIGPSSGSCGGFFPAYGCQDGIDGMPRNFWAENRPAFIYAHKIARTPYVTAYGPDADTLAVSPNPVQRGTPLNLSAHLQDHRCCGDTPQNIGGAEYFIDRPGQDGAGTPMSPQDGSWGGASETGIATVDTAPLPPGRHYILVHAKNTSNQWGPFTAVFFTVEGECLPVSNAAFAWTPITPTVGQAVAFSGSAQGDAPISFAWDFGDGTTGSGANPTHAYNMPGTFTVVMTATNCGGDGVDSVSHPVTVIEPCDPPTGTDFTWAPPTPWAGETVYFTASVAGGTPPISFDWDFGDGTVASGETVSHTYAAPGDYTVVVNASNTCGLETAEHAISVAQPCEPVHGAAFAWSPVTPTVGEAVSFQGTAQGDPPIGYAWDFGDGAAGSGPNPIHTYAAAGDYTVVMTASNCTTATERVSALLTVAAPEVVVPPVPTATLEPGQAGLGTLVISNSGNYTLNWTLSEVVSVDWLDETPTAGAVAPGGYLPVTLLYTAPVTPGLYSAVLRIESNDPLSPTVDVEVVLVVQVPCDPVHNAAFTWSPAVPHVGETVTFTGTADGDAPITYTWKLDVGSWKEGRVVTYTYDLTGTYNVLMTVTNCHTHTAVVEHPVQVIAPGACVPAYGADFTFAPAIPLVHRPVLFTATVSGDAPFTYTWSFGDGTYGGGQTAAHAYGLPGPYTVVLTATNCGGAGRSVASRIVTVAYQIYLPLVYRQH